MVPARFGFGQLSPLDVQPAGGEYPAICDMLGGGLLEKFSDVCTPKTPAQILAEGHAADEATLAKQRALGYDTSAAEAVLAKQKEEDAALIAADLAKPQNCSAKFYFDHPTLATWISGDTVCSLSGGDAALAYNLLIAGIVIAGGVAALIIVGRLGRRPSD